MAGKHSETVRTDHKKNRNTQMRRLCFTQPRSNYSVWATDRCCSPQPTVMQPTRSTVKSHFCFSPTTPLEKIKSFHGNYCEILSWQPLQVEWNWVATITRVLMCLSFDERPSCGGLLAFFMHIYQSDGITCLISFILFPAPFALTFIQFLS